MYTQEQMISLVMDMTTQERKDLLKELYLRELIDGKAFRDFLGIDEETFQKSVSEYEYESAMEAIDGVSDEFIIEMIIENE